MREVWKVGYKVEDGRMIGKLKMWLLLQVPYRNKTMKIALTHLKNLHTLPDYILGTYSLDIGPFLARKRPYPKGRFLGAMQLEQSDYPKYPQDYPLPKKYFRIEPGKHTARYIRKIGFVYRGKVIKVAYNAPNTVQEGMKLSEIVPKARRGVFNG